MHDAMLVSVFYCGELSGVRLISEYGTVLELRINSGGKLPNFGFVVFDDSEPVQKILSNRVCLTSVFFILCIVDGSDFIRY